MSPVNTVLFNPRGMHAPRVISLLELISFLFFNFQLTIYLTDFH